MDILISISELAFVHTLSNDLFPPNGDGFCFNIGHLKALFETCSAAGVAGLCLCFAFALCFPLAEACVPVVNKTDFAGKNGNGNGHRSLADMIWRIQDQLKNTYLTGLSADPYWSAIGQYLAERDAINHFPFFLIWDKLVKHWTRGAFEKGPSLLAR